MALSIAHNMNGVKFGTMWETDVDSNQHKTNTAGAGREKMKQASGNHFLIRCSEKTVVAPCAGNQHHLNVSRFLGILQRSGAKGDDDFRRKHFHRSHSCTMRS